MINEYKIKLTGTANIPQELGNSSTWDITIKNAEVRKKSFDPNDDGTENLTHTIKIAEFSEVNLINETGIVSAKKKGSQSRALRFYIEKEADELGVDREEHYQERMTEIISEVKERLYA